jgi:hypothetical protein
MLSQILFLETIQLSTSTKPILEEFFIILLKIKGSSIGWKHS